MVGIPLALTVAAVNAHLGSAGARIGLTLDGPGWSRCSEVDPKFIADWEDAVTRRLSREYGRSHPATAAAYVLGWCGQIPGRIGGASFRIARRVPILTCEALAFRRDALSGKPDAVALLETPFWCLPEDPAADHPDARVVPDLPALAGVLRAQVREHADDFLARYASKARLPRRNRYAVFVDGLDGALGVHHNPLTLADALSDAALTLPCASAEFADASTLFHTLDEHGQPTIERTMIACCFYFKVADDAVPCSTCPRTIRPAPPT